VRSGVAETLYAEQSGFAAQTIRNAHKHVFANSWCMGPETLGMWERYGAGAKGVAIESTVGRFKNALTREVRAEQYAFGSVKYHGDLSKAFEIRHDFTRGSVPASASLWKLALNVGFHKRSFYEDEKEWRTSIFQDRRGASVPGLLLPTDLQIVIKSVHIGPRADGPTVDAVMYLLKCTGLAGVVDVSRILQRPRVRRSR
jgi:hypothetical protein